MNSVKRFSFRSLVSLTLTLAFLVLALTGVVLYIVPPGRVAFWIDWRFLGMTKEQRSSVHTIFSFLFVILSILHIQLNWRALMNHLRTKIENSLRLRKKTAAAAVIVVSVFAGTLMELPPFGTTMDIGESIKNSWEEGVSAAPAPHTELKTVEEVAGDFGMRPDRVLDKLGRNGVSGAVSDKTLKDLATENGMSPSDLYEIIARRGGGGQH